MAAPANSSEKGLSLKLVTYNIWGLPFWMTGERTGRYQQIARELERLDPDFILLQEAWTAKVPDIGARQRPMGHRPGGRAAHVLPAERLGDSIQVPDHWRGVLSLFSRGVPGPVREQRRAQSDRPIAGEAGAQCLERPSAGGQHSPEVRRSQVRELVSRVQAAEDGQIADLVGGDFNCTPESPLCRELANSLGPSVQQLGGTDPFVTWDGLSAKPGAGQTIDYIFIRERAPCQERASRPARGIHGGEHETAAFGSSRH